MPTAASPSPARMNPEEAVRRVCRAREVLLSEVHKVIIGQDEMIEQMLIAMFARGHCLTIGVPGLAKTLTVSTLAQALHLKFSRIQFTPDLMPSDITGTEIIEEDTQTGRRVFRFVRGPVFSNIVLADEINRTPPKTQSALLQSMQEYQVTAGGNTYDLDRPFFVMATQNPIEQEGTYPLPEAQLDRFMLSINIGYPTKQEECDIVNATTQDSAPEVRQVLRTRDILWIQKLVRQIPATQHIVEYAVDLARATRPNEPDGLDFVKNWLAWGAGPRAAQYLILGAKARALLKGRFAVHAADVRALAKPVLRHRIFTNFNADAEGVDTDQVIDRIVKSVAEPAYGEQGGEPPTLIVVSDPGNAPQIEREMLPPLASSPGPTTPASALAPAPHAPAPHAPAPEAGTGPAAGAPGSAAPPTTDPNAWPPGTSPQ